MGEKFYDLKKQLRNKTESSTSEDTKIIKKKEEKSTP